MEVKTWNPENYSLPILSYPSPSFLRTTKIEREIKNSMKSSVITQP
jgi:hypothetical protein